MPNARALRRRIQSVKSTQQITRAMKVVSAAKLYRAQKNALAAKPYARQLKALFARLVAQTEDADLPLLQKREIKRTLVILITGNRGLAGGFNNALIRRALLEQGDSTSYIAFGSKGRDALVSAGCTVTASYCQTNDRLLPVEAEKLGQQVIALFESGACDCVKLVYQQFLSAGSQMPNTDTLLPVQTVSNDSEGDFTGDCLFEGGRREILEAVARRYVCSGILQAVMESSAGEHLARMLAMSAATDNASDMIRRLQMDYNRSRQAAVTQEIAEISGCANAVM